MKTLTKAVLLLAAQLSATGSSFAATTYAIDPQHSSAQFSVRHMTVSNVRGEFSNVSGTVVYDPKDLSASKVDAKIDTATLTTREPDRDKHLKSPDFFDVAKFPQMTFQSKEFIKNGDKLQIKGDLTIHGVSKPVVLDVDGPSAEAKDPWGKMRLGASGTTTVNRKDFGLVWNKTLDGGGVLVGDDVKITLDIEAVRN
jgi:polyisoprenoid-binding protein YceI